MNISSFEDLLQAARLQSEPQRLLFVFAAAELPQDATRQQRNNFARGHGGALVPALCVDKAPHELQSFAQLVEESRQTGTDWSMVFVAALSGIAGVAPSSETADKALQRMVESIKAGQLGSFIPFGKDGLPVLLS